MSILIKNIDIITMDSDRVLRNSNLYVENGKIAYMGDDISDIRADKVIDGRDKLLMPGLVNAHTHIGMSVLRNYADDLPLHEWLTEKIWPIEAKLTGDDIYKASLLSIAEMIQTGTTSFCDMYFAMDRVAEAVEESGIRAVLTQGLIEDDKADEKLHRSIKFFKDWHGKADDRIRVMLAPHAPYTCGKDYLLRIKEEADKLGTGLHIHLAETEKEYNDSLASTGLSPIAYVDSIGLLDGHVIGAHCVHLNDQDLKIIRNRKFYPVNNPTSNLKLASGFMRLEEMLDLNIPVSLGTDGSSSNNNLNMFEEIHIASILNKALNKSATSVSAFEALQMATVNGARALGYDDLGMVKEGYRADLIILDLKKPHLRPIHDLISLVAYSAQGSDVDTVIIDGRLVMENRKILSLNLDQLMEDVDALTLDLLNR